MKKSRLVMTFALILVMIFALSATVGARNGPFETIEEVIGEGNILVANPEFVDGGEGWGGGAEGPEMLFDGQIETKYGAGGGMLPYWAIWRYSEAFVANRLLIATANDSAQHHRRPDDWTLSGSNDGENWTVIHEGSPNDIYHYNWLWFYVELDNNEAFRYYQFFTDFGYDSDGVQLSRLELTRAAEAAAPPPEEPPADDPAETKDDEPAPVVDQPAPQQPTPAPPTFDPITLIAVGAFASLAGGAVVVKTRKK